MTIPTATTVKTATELEVGDVLALNSGGFTVTEPVTDAGHGDVRIVGTNGDGVAGWWMLWPADRRVGVA